MNQMANPADQRSGETIDGSTGKVIAPPARRRAQLDLETVRGVRVELSSLYRKVRRGRLASDEANKRAYLLRQISEHLVVEQFEQRLERLESRRARAAPGDVLPLRSVA
jgi:hypothetical protein